MTQSPGAAWSDVARAAADKWGTPVYVMRWAEIEESLRRLERIPSELPVKQWWSCKTLALAPVLRRWRQTGYGAEVVSPFELRAVLAEGFDPRQVLVNGTAKHRWIGAVGEARGLRVQIDSLHEARMLSSAATNGEWSIGLRLHTSANRDPDDERYADQFGVRAEEVPEVLRTLRAQGVDVTCMGFHLRSNLRSTAPTIVALRELAAVCQTNGIAPAYVNLGGGLPVRGEVINGVDGARFDVSAMAGLFGQARELFPSARELWLENGRFLASRAGALALRVWDIKQRDGMRYLICDGGRVNNALPSDWQRHRLEVPGRSGSPVATSVCGPTCMAYDLLGRLPLPDDIEIGDLLLWHNAGAYHLAWETRFSFGLTPVVWVENDGRMELVRAREEFRSWWSQP